MGEPQGLRRWIRLPWRSRKRIHNDIDDEFQFHLDMRVSELEARGLAPERAHAEAMRRFGDVSDAKEYCRTMDERSTHEEQRRAWFAELGSDIRFAFRQLRHSPVFATLAIVTLALGIGATTAIFSVVNRMVLDPIPYPGGDRIVNLSRTNKEGNLYVTPTPRLLKEWRTRVKSLEGVAGFSWNDVSLAGREEAEEIKAGEISAELLPLLQVKPVLGRGILPEDTRVGAPGVVLLGYGLWQRRFGGARDVLGQSLTIDGKPYTIVGVMPRDFSVPFMDNGVRPLWMPMIDDPDARGAQAIGKFRVGTDRARLDKELTDVLTALGAESPEFRDWKAKASRPQDYLGDSTRDTLFILLGAVGMVLLIACANVANLLLARASTRQREFAIRAALGAGRWRIIRQLLTESALLAVAGGALGLFVANRGLAIIVALRPDRLSELDEVRLSPTVLLVSLGLTILTGILFGLAPALFAAARDIGSSLKSATRSASGHQGTRRLRNMLVIGEVTLSVLLLVGAGLLIRTMVQMSRADLGFEASGLTAARIELPEKKFPSREVRRVVYGQLYERLRAIPGVSEATWAGGIPPRAGVSFGQLDVEGVAVKENERSAALWSQWGDGEYFRALRLPLVAGRPFSADTAVSEIILNESMANRYWPGGNAVGRRLRFSEKGPWVTVVGVAKNITVPSTGRKTVGGISDFQVYFRFAGDHETATLLIRTSTPIPDLARRITREATAIDAGIRIREVTGVDVALAKELAGPKFNMSLLVAFAGLALLLATVGLYGVIAYSVSQRTREMGIRLALGAGQPAVLRLVLSQGARLTVVGLVAGLATAAALTRVMVGMLYGVSPLDPLTFVLVGAILGLVAVFASYFPARRATQVDPVIALRAE
jgi:predicted permease